MRKGNARLKIHGLLVSGQSFVASDWETAEAVPFFGLFEPPKWTWVLMGVGGDPEKGLDESGFDKVFDEDWVPNPASNLVPTGDVRSRESRSDKVCDKVSDGSSDTCFTSFSVGVWMGMP